MKKVIIAIFSIALVVACNKKMITMKVMTVTATSIMKVTVTIIAMIMKHIHKKNLQLAMIL